MEDVPERSKPSPEEPSGPKAAEIQSEPLTREQLKDFLRDFMGLLAANPPERAETSQQETFHQRLKRLSQNTQSGNRFVKGSDLGPIVTFSGGPADPRKDDPDR